MTNASPARRKSVDMGRWLLTAAVVLGGVGYVFRHSLFPGDHATEALAQAPAEAAMAVTVVTAERQGVARRVVAGGTLVARDEVLIAAEVTGVRIEQVLVEPGDTVAEGQLMAVLDSQRIDLLLAQKAADQARTEAAVAEAEALASEADAAAAEARVLLERARRLGESGTISAQLLGERQTAAATAMARAQAQAQALAVARAELLRVVAERDDLSWQLSQVEVRASAPGVVIERTAKVGQTTASDGTPLFRIMQDGAAEMEALVIETALSSMRTGMAVEVTVAGSTRPVEGTVRLVLPAVDAATRMGKVRISLTGEGLKPGSFATAVFATDAREAILLPHSAVLQGEGGARVLVVRDGRVVFRSVEAGLVTVSGVEILSGIEPGEVVVAMAGGFLREGSPVSPVPAALAGDG